MANVDGYVIVRFDTEVTVSLPEGVEFQEDGDDQVTEKCRERAIDAALGAFPDNISIYMDSTKDKLGNPTSVCFDVSEDDVQEVRGEEE